MSYQSKVDLIEARAEIAALKQDLGRQIEIASFAMTEAQGLRARVTELERIVNGHNTVRHEIEQVLGKALGYPFLDHRVCSDCVPGYGCTCNDPVVCIGEHVTESLADEAARRIRDLEAGRTAPLATATPEPAPAADVRAAALLVQRLAAHFDEQWELQDLAFVRMLAEVGLAEPLKGDRPDIVEWSDLGRRLVERGGRADG